MANMEKLREGMVARATEHYGRGDYAVAFLQVCSPEILLLVANSFTAWHAAAMGGYASTCLERALDSVFALIDPSRE